jgi:hypothetical protein
MRQKYLEVVDEVELLKEDLDAVSRDLDHLSNGKGAEIHATIDRFGKTANLKLHDAPLAEGDEPEQPPKYTGLKFFGKPTVRQVPPLPAFRADNSTFSMVFCIEASRWKRRGRWSCLSICFTLELLPLMRLPSPQTRTLSSYIFSR